MDSQGRKRRKRLLSLVLVALIVAIAAGMILPGLWRSREGVVTPKCLNNLRQLARAERMYAIDHNRKFSENLSDLYPDYVTGLDVFTCPTSKDPKIARKEDVVALTSYVLRKGLTLDSPAGQVLIYEKAAHHPGPSGFAAFVDGHVRRLSALELHKIIEKDRANTSRGSQ